ncbi:MAG: response regulator transcription factor [Kiritimatiellaeota bacterium]|nr:response regulator transcription factor [Kiritimatiellota bacterium]
MKKPTILVVDDERDIRDLVSYHLTRSGFMVVTAADGERALEVVRETVPDLIVLDLMLPGMDGLDVCRLLRRDPRTSHVPVVMLTARDDETDVVTGLELGANDYVAKPFSPRILVARVRAALRSAHRTPAEDEEGGRILRVGDLAVDEGRRKVAVGDRRIDVTFTEFNILLCLARRPGWVFSRQHIIEEVHGDGYPVTERAVDVHIVSLRRKLGEYGERIETVRGVGYRLRD